MLLQALTSDASRDAVKSVMSRDFLVSATPGFNTSSGNNRGATTSFATGFQYPFQQQNQKHTQFSFLYGLEPEMSGYLHFRKAGVKGGAKRRVFFKLKGAILSAHDTEVSSPFAEFDVFKSKVNASWIFDKKIVLTTTVRVMVPQKKSKRGQDDSMGLKTEKNNEQTPLVMKTSKISIVLVAEAQQDCERWKDALLYASQTCLDDFYSLGEPLGCGAFAEVRWGMKHSGEQVAVKIINRHQISKSNLITIEREVTIMKTIKHKCVLRVIDTFNTVDKLFIVTEYMAGGTLASILKERPVFTENQAKQVIKDILSGVAHLHSQGIVHRDIKAENILCKNRHFPLQLKIADFGFATRFNSCAWNTPMLLQSLLGSPSYIAPEILRRERYGPAVDIWACGVTLFRLLSGRFPFNVENMYGDLDETRTFNMVLRGAIQYRADEWSNLSRDVIDLTKRMMTYEVSERITAQEALQHRWFQTGAKLEHMG